MKTDGRGRKCRVCQHESRAAIDQAVLNGKSLTAVARTFGITYAGPNGPVPDHKIIQRHRDSCMADAYQATLTENLTAHGVKIASRLQQLDEAVDEVLAEARVGQPVMVGDTQALGPDGYPLTRKDHRMMLAAVREARANADMLARLSGAVTDEDQDALKAARLNLESAEARRLIAQLEDLHVQQAPDAPG